MEIAEALERLKEYPSELEHLRTLHHDNRERGLWKNKVDVVIEATFGKDSGEYKKLNPTSFHMPMLPSDAEKQKDYLRDLDNYEAGIKEIFDKYEILGTETKPAEKETEMSTTQPKVFIAHGGDVPALRKLKRFLDALGIQPLVVEEQPSEGRSIAENVDYYARLANFAIILATKGDIDSKTGGFIPRGNVSIEIGKLQEIFKEKIVYLLQAGTKFPSNASEKVWVHFTPQSMDNAFIKVANELRNCGILKAVKPQKQE